MHVGGARQRNGFSGENGGSARIAVVARLVGGVNVKGGVVHVEQVVAEPGGRIARRLALGQACRHALDHAVHARLKEERTREPACRVCGVCVTKEWE